jgi:predicted transport protein
MKMLIIDSIRYKLWTPRDEEKEFHPMVKEHSEEIFGEDSIYFDIKHKLTSKSGIAAIPDAYVITLSKPYEWYIVENELASHPVYSHIVPQVSKFVDSIEELETQRDIRDILNNEIEQDTVLKAYIEKKTGRDPYRFLSELLSSSPKIALIIDEVTPEVDQASKSLKKLANTEIIEFKTFVREDAPNVHAHLFEPLYVIEKATEKGGEEVEGKRSLPKHYESWEKMLEWVDKDIRDIVNVLTVEIPSSLGKEITETIHGRYKCFYKGKPSTKSIFAAFLLTKRALKVRIRTDPKTFTDYKNWTRGRVYSGWFFKQGQEREFKITSKEQITYAMELIKQSYELAR